MGNKPKIESITIVSGSRLSAVERARLNISQEDFAEIRIIRNSPKRMEKKAIKKEIKPTEGFRDSIKRANLFNTSF
ncbi:MAG: hypothetical protein KJ566_00650 [Nanoarchaeota archaeon]|nr:hypothetical protein [Nanoarchaeota archaeon]